MKIIIGHYHLNPGGVTKIIQSQINGLAQMPNTELVLVCDGQGFHNLSLPASVTTLTNPALGYLPQLPSAQALQGIVSRLVSFFENLVQQGDIIHFHNIGLGKNVAVTYAMFLLAQKGYTLINHAHDFPEDRPANYRYLQDGLALLTDKPLSQVLYPKKQNYCFGVLNSFDKQRLKGFGVEAASVHVWPNPVNQPGVPAELTKEVARKQLIADLDLVPGKKIIVYPVRVIRRKNIGEYILLAALFGAEAHWIVTLPPLNPVEIKAYQQWVKFCAEHHIPVTFEAGLKTDFAAVMKGADVCFTTSIMEGFGMVFVEPWFWDTPVAGREIPAVLPDLRQLGIRFPFIYKHIWVEWENRRVDFPTLETTQQMACIKYYFSDRKEMFLQQNPEFLSFFKEDLRQNIQHNKSIIAHDLSERKYGNQLHQLYTALSS